MQHSKKFNETPHHILSLTRQKIYTHHKQTVDKKNYKKNQKHTSFHNYRIHTKKNKK